MPYTVRKTNGFTLHKPGGKRGKRTGRHRTKRKAYAQIKAIMSSERRRKQ